MRNWLLWVLALIWLPAHAHKPSDSYLFLKVEESRIEGRWDMALRDLEAAVGLDADGDGNITWAEVRASHGAIEAYALANLAVTTSAGACPLSAGEHLIEEHTDGAYAVMMMSGTCAGPPTRIDVRYGLLFEIDAQHRGLLRVEGLGPVRNAIFTAEARDLAFDASVASGAAQFGAFVRDGVKHIAIGLDHILFLVALLLPAVLVRVEGRWRPTASLPRTLLNVGGIVTAFTVAHSITLTAAALQWVQVPSRLVESLIAASVVLTALDNLFPFLPRRRWIVAFTFGLLHGFGFASVLLDLGLPRETLALSLLGFNVGVEVGQLLLVLLLIPLAHALRRTTAYPRYAVGVGSAAIALAATGWMVERAFGMAFMPF